MKMHNTINCRKKTTMRSWPKCMIVPRQINETVKSCNDSMPYIIASTKSLFYTQPACSKFRVKKQIHTQWSAYSDIWILAYLFHNSINRLLTVSCCIFFFQIMCLSNFQWCVIFHVLWSCLKCHIKILIFQRFFQRVMYGCTQLSQLTGTCFNLVRAELRKQWLVNLQKYFTSGQGCHQRGERWR